MTSVSAAPRPEPRTDVGSGWEQLQKPFRLRGRTPWTPGCGLQPGLSEGGQRRGTGCRALGQGQQGSSFLCSRTHEPGILPSLCAFIFFISDPLRLPGT